MAKTQVSMTVNGKAVDALVVDSSGLDVDQVVATILDRARTVMGQ